MKNIFLKRNDLSTKNNNDAILQRFNFIEQKTEQNLIKINVLFSSEYISFLAYNSSYKSIVNKMSRKHSSNNVLQELFDKYKNLMTLSNEKIEKLKQVNLKLNSNLDDIKKAKNAYIAHKEINKVLKNENPAFFNSTLGIIESLADENEREIKSLAYSVESYKEIM